MSANQRQKGGITFNTAFGGIEDLVTSLAKSHTILQGPARSGLFLDELRQHEALLHDAYQRCTCDAELSVCAASEWLLDNFFFVLQALRQVREDMPESYYRQLPKLDGSAWAGYPRIYALAQEIIGQTNGSILDMDLVARFVEAYQRVVPLTIRELWALPNMLRLGVLENLTRAVARITGPPAHPGEESCTGVPSVHHLADETLVKNSILSLRAIESQEWKYFFETVSRVEQVLRGDPANVYARMDFDTRDSYRHVVEELARATDQSEEEVAWAAIRLAKTQSRRAEKEQPNDQAQRRTTHVGFYLLDTGRAQLEARIGYRPAWHVRLRRWFSSHSIIVYLGSIALLTLVVVLGFAGYSLAVGGSLLQLMGVSLLGLVPAVTVAVNLVNWIITATVPPRALPRLDFKQGIPADCRTMVIVPALVTGAGEVERLLQQLELHFLGNGEPNLYFALLTDFTDAPRQHMPYDDALLAQAKAGIQALNEKYGKSADGPFYLFHRTRSWNPSEGYWMGWERKRGKLVELNRLLRGSGETSFSVQMGNLEVLPDIKYVITLDADTTLPPESARRLIATLAHVLNRAEFDPGGRGIVAGYTVLQPRLQVWPTSTHRSLFTRIFAGDYNLDLYTGAVSNVYQDLFGEGIYAGKGIYDVAAFQRSLTDRVSDNTLLSHDLFEGLYARTGLVTDVTLFEDYPPHYLAYVRRLHRWVRGDWQLLPWLLPRVPRAGGGTMPNELSVLAHWKILDNLRRSFFAPTLLALLVAGWLWFPGSPLVWTLVGLLISGSPFAASIVTSLAGESWRVSSSRASQPVWAEIARWMLMLSFLPYETLLMLDAIVRTLVRLTITRRHLLQWTTAAHTVRLFGSQLRSILVWREMAGVPLLTLGLALLMGWANPRAFSVAVPLLLPWLVSPQIAYWISRPVVQEESPLSDDQRQELGRLARRTWLYFEEFVGPDDQWLPPDYYQPNPRGLVGHQTSPTNVAMLLLSTLSAYDLGYLSPMELALRLRYTFETLDKLERHWGHLYNWYDTIDLEPLPPRYISTVDSGNLAACLLALRQGLQALPRDSVLRWQRWEGLLDALGILAEILDSLKLQDRGTIAGPVYARLASIRQRVLSMQDDSGAWAAVLTRIRNEDWQELVYLLESLIEDSQGVLDAGTLGDLRVWMDRVYHHLISAQRELDSLAPWLLPMSQPPVIFNMPDAHPDLADAWRALVQAMPTSLRLDEVDKACIAVQARLAELRDRLSDASGPTDRVQEARAWCTSLAERCDSAREEAKNLLSIYKYLAGRAESYFQAMDFGFLFDWQRQVFHIGYNVDTGTVDPNHYDLIASEARTASLVAIAKGDVPYSHWLYLSRPFTLVQGMPALLSWGGTMFEYLMPALLMRAYKGTVLEQSYRAVVNQQIAYGRQKNVPWGISESGYYRFDANMRYQYQAFGVPGLGLKRGLEEDLVVSPYASLLALSLQPQAVMENIGLLTQLEMLGRYGFFEAIDYTRYRLPSAQKSAILNSYMAHHQGMILLSLANYLQSDLMVRRFHADLRVQTVELLLHESMPRQVRSQFGPPVEVSAPSSARPEVGVAPWRVPLGAPLSQVHCLGNGRYNVVITGTGAGYSNWREVELTRWRTDSTLDNWGTWIYVQDRDSGALWSAAYQPTASRPDYQELLFYAHKARFQRRDHDISLHMEITVPPDDDVEIRRITLTSHGNRARRLMLTSYGEIVLAPQAADSRHPAFSKLFIESEFVPEINALFFRRRRRSTSDGPVYLAHMLVLGRGGEITKAYETDRARFLGRGGSPRTPAALIEKGDGLSGTSGATLDPIMSIAQEIELRPHATVQLAYITLAASSQQEALALASRYHEWPAIEEAFRQAQTHVEYELSQLGVSTSELESFQQLLSVLLYPHGALRPDPRILAANTKGQPGLWPYGISGDHPILLVCVESTEQIALVRELLLAHSYWRSRGIKVDLVILNQRDVSYSQELQYQLSRVITLTHGAAWLNQRGGIFILRADQMNEADEVLLRTVARAVLEGRMGSLAEQLKKLNEQPAQLPRLVPTGRTFEGIGPTPSVARPPELLFDNGLGGFSADGREYVIYLEPGHWTPAPWINVIANPEFGFLVSEAGSGYTWAQNSGENRLTPWNNDPVTDAPGEALYVRDEETGEFWSPTPLPARARAPYLIRHGAGYSAFEHDSHGLRQRLRVFAVPDDPVKVVHLRLQNLQDRNRQITVTFYAEWVLGTTRDVAQQHVISWFDAERHALLANNPYNEEFGDRVAFLASSQTPHSQTADRTEFLGRHRDLSHPAALDRIALSSNVKAGLDPCAALQLYVALAPGEAKEIFFLLGQGRDRREALRLVEQYQDATQVEAAWKAVNDLWDTMLGGVTVQTCDQSMNLLMNRWLLYQVISCRVWGRSALYQSSGAFGFRDQLQDVMALLHVAPDVARAHILRAAAHQFEAGDVLHWWHEPSDRGVRTRYSDDLLWLPFVTAHYVSTTDDKSILTEQAPFLVGDPLESEEVERYGRYEITAETYDLYKHCLRALEKGLTAGPHGLPLMGGGDWNDGMNRVGINGQGESVWLGWFLYSTLSRFAPLCELMGDHEQAGRYRQQADDLRQALEAQAWDGEWYRRAYYDDGTPLGSADSEECQIASLAQSWAVLSGAGNQARSAQAMEAVYDRLVRREDGVVLLFTPPFDKTARDPGYIKGYPPGIRENGGQYTHAALWAVWAFAELGQGDRAQSLFRLLNPIHHSATPEQVARYKVEPYVVSADVYSVTPHVGHGGWTWYTGAAAWMYRVGLEAILGLRRMGQALRIDPCIPRDWSGFSIDYRHGSTTYHIRVENPHRVSRGVKQVRLDGELRPRLDVPLLRDGKPHRVDVRMG